MKLLTPKQTQAITGLSTTATYNMFWSKGFPKIVLGKRSPTDKEKVWLVSDTNEQDLYKYLESKKQIMH